MGARGRHPAPDPHGLLAVAGHRRAGGTRRRPGRGGAVHEGPDRHRAQGHGLRLHVGQLRGRARRRARSGVVHARRGRFGRGHDERRAGRGVVPPRHHPAGRGHPVRRRRDGAAARLPRGVRRDASPGPRTSGCPGASGRCPTPSLPRSCATWPPRAAKPSSSPARTCRPTTSSPPWRPSWASPS